MFLTTKLTFAIALFLSGSSVLQVHAQSGNSINKPLAGEKIPVGKPYVIEWVPSTPGKISLSLLQGPSSKLLNTIGVIASGIDNSGSFTWTPSTSLVEGLAYGINLTVDADPTSFQYSNGFAIVNPNSQPGSSTTTTTTTTAHISTTTAIKTTTTPPPPPPSSEPTQTSTSDSATESATSPATTESSAVSNTKSNLVQTKTSFLSVTASASKTAASSSTPSGNATKPLTGGSSESSKHLASGTATIAFVVAGLFASFFI